MKKLIVVFLILPVLVVLIILGAKLTWKSAKTSGGMVSLTNANGSGVANAVVATVNSSPGKPGLLGETIIAGYADTNLPPQNDLTLMSRLMDNSLLLLKSAANQPLSANEDWAAFLRGQNAAHERFLPDSSVAFNAKGQVIDRWGTPLFFHALGGGRYEVRSAGPDAKLWTDDDIHRNADGSFRRGEGLNPASLMPTNPGIRK